MKSLVPLLAAAACGTPPPSWVPDAGPCVAYAVPETTDLTRPAISFATDVMPLFAKHCSSTVCHGIADSPKGDLFLGTQLAAGGDGSEVYAKLVGPSGQLASMKFVTATNLAQSYLMHKVDNDQCQFDTECVGQDCLRQMPFGDVVLPAETRDVLRRWIAQGAENN